MALKKRIRIIKKIRENAGVWNSTSLKRIGNRYVWDKRPGYFFIVNKSQGFGGAGGE
jgi:hypothetical protein